MAFVRMRRRTGWSVTSLRTSAWDVATAARLLDVSPSAPPPRWRPSPTWESCAARTCREQVARDGRADGGSPNESVFPADLFDSLMSDDDEEATVPVLTKAEARASEIVKTRSGVAH